jgi:hypothetical protein
MGKGNYDKAQMAKAALNRYGFVADNEHVVDAYCLARYLHAYIHGKDLSIEFVQYPFVDAALLQPSARPENKDCASPLTKKLRRITLPTRSHPATARAFSA